MDPCFPLIDLLTSRFLSFFMFPLKILTGGCHNCSVHSNIQLTLPTIKQHDKLVMWACSSTVHHCTAQCCHFLELLSDQAYACKIFTCFRSFIEEKKASMIINRYHCFWKDTSYQVLEQKRCCMLYTFLSLS
jgi:hypothetical protein